MKTYVERTLKKIRDVSEQKKLHLSCDIYYDDLAVERGEQFVVKLYSRITKINEHFRSDRIRKSMKKALEFVKSY